jgi:hypothetical protein
MAVNAADPEQIQSRNELQEIRRRQDVIDLREALNFAPARRTIWRWIERLRPLDRIFDDEAALLGYKAAFHDVGVMLLNEVREADPEAELLMLREARDRDKARDAAGQSRRKRGNQG